jgi:hypothetical protein
MAGWLVIRRVGEDDDQVVVQAGGPDRWRGWRVAVAVFVIGRRRWLNASPAKFAWAIRVPDGEVERLSPKWKHGSGRWVRGIRRENHPRTTCRHLRSSL